MSGQLKWADVMATKHVLPAPLQALTPPPVGRRPLWQLWQVPVFLIGLLSLAGVWSTRPLWYDPEGRQLQHDLALARHMLEDPKAAVNGVPALLVDALNRIERLPGRAGEAHFLLGSAYLRLADPLPPERASDLRQEARLHLERAETLGVPDRDRALLAYRLGKAWYQTERDPARIILYLSRSIDQVPDNRSEGYAMLTQAYLRLPVPDLRAALLANEKQLQLPTSDESLLAPARLLRGELLLSLHDREAARKVLARIGPGAPPAILSQARHLRVRSYQDEDAWAEAAPLWEAILADPREKTADRSRIMYYLGSCYRNLNRPADAARLWEQAAEYGGEVAQAASLRLAELRVESGQRKAVLPLYERALGAVTRPEDYHNTLVDLARARQILENGCGVHREAGDFENARKLALLHARLAPAEPAQVLLGQVTEAWAHALSEESQASKTSEAPQTYFQEAGRAYEAAALASTAPPARSDWLWHAGQDYLLARNFAQAEAILERFLKQEPNPAPERQAEAWYRLGEAHEALGNTKVAAVSYNNCIAQGGPFAFRARYQLALAEIERGNATEAEEALRHNLELMHLEPDREAHEKSLYALADLLYQRRNYRMASQRWDQALALYPTNPGAGAARYRLADCYRHLADVEYQSLRPGEPFARSTHGHYRKQYILWLEMAGANYQKVVDDLEARQTTGRLRLAESVLLRQAQFALAACRFDGGNFDEAIRLYDHLALRYQSQVDGLKAVRELYRCYVVPIPPHLENARPTLQRALFMLNNLEDSAFQGLPENESRAAWEKWHKGAVEELRKLSP